MQDTRRREAVLSSRGEADVHNSQSISWQDALRAPSKPCLIATFLLRSQLLKGLQYVPRVIITDKLKSYGAAKREILSGVEHRQSRYLNNRCENSHRPTRQRESWMQGFKSAGHAQRFLSAYGPIAQHFRPRRHLLSGAAYRQEMKNRFESWADITGSKRAA